MGEELLEVWRVRCQQAVQSLSVRILLLKKSASEAASEAFKTRKVVNLFNLV